MKHMFESHFDNKEKALKNIFTAVFYKPGTTA